MYEVRFTPRSLRMLANLDRGVAARIRPRIAELAENPRPSGCIKLSGQHVMYRIRIGDYRVVYQINDAAATVDISAIAHRREIYRDL